MKHIHKHELQERLSLVDLEYDIRSMETELDFHQQKIRLFEPLIREQQQMLSQIRKQQSSQQFKEADPNE